VTESSRRAARVARPRSVTALVRALEDPGRGPLLAALLAARARPAEAGPGPDGRAAETLALLADGFLERLASCGVRPVHRPGERLCLPARELARRYEYHGAPLRPGERRKRVVVVAAGWTVGARLAVRPVVREATDEDGGAGGR